jgi:hypothetical protein
MQFLFKRGSLSCLPFINSTNFLEKTEKHVFLISGLSLVHQNEIGCTVRKFSSSVVYQTQDLVCGRQVLCHWPSSPILTSIRTFGLLVSTDTVGGPLLWTMYTYPLQGEVCSAIAFYGVVQGSREEPQKGDWREAWSYGQGWQLSESMNKEKGWFWQIMNQEAERGVGD